MLKIYMKNPFKRIQLFTADQILDFVFSHASDKVEKLDFDVRRTKYGTTRMKGMEEIVYQKEGVRISTCSNVFYNKLVSIISAVPKKGDIPEIYMIFADELVGWSKLENSVARIRKVANYSKKLQGKYLDKLKKVGTTGRMRIVRKEYYGRVAGMVKKIDKDLDFLVKSFDLLRGLPSLKDVPTVVLVGLPNVGKTSLLKAITGSKPEIKPYPFTTKGLMVGYFPYRYSEVQLIDTPGILDRKKRNKIEIHSQIALERIGEVMVYVFDISETCGYTVEQQLDFYKRVRKEVKKPIICVVNKTDVRGVPSVEEITNFVDAILVSCESGKGISELKKEITSKVF